jgi:hypothetical protein
MRGKVKNRVIPNGSVLRRPPSRPAAPAASPAGGMPPGEWRVPGQRVMTPLRLRPLRMSS